MIAHAWERSPLLRTESQREGEFCCQKMQTGCLFLGDENVTIIVQYVTCHKTHNV